MSMAYFPPGYWSPGYWSPGYWSSAEGGAGSVEDRRDDVVLRDVRDRILATGHFSEDAVELGGGPEEIMIAADREVACWIDRDRWREEQRSGAPPSEVRRLDFVVWLEARVGSLEYRLGRLAQVEQAVQAAINEQQLAGFCQPAFTRLEAGQDAGRQGRHGRRTRLSGRTRYFLEVDGRYTMDAPH